MINTAPSSVTRSAATEDGTPRRTSQPCTGANSTARTGIPMIPVAYGPRDHTSATPNAKTMNAARWCLVSRNAISLAATSLHAQDAGQRLPVNRDRDEIVAGRDLIRRAAKSTEATAAGRCSAERLGNESQRAEAPPAPATAATLPGLPQQRAERREEARVGRRIARLAAALAPGSRQSRARGGCARRRFTGPLVEPPPCKRCATSTSTSTSSTSSAEPDRKSTRLNSSH